MAGDINKRTVGRMTTMSVAIQDTTNDPSTSTLSPLGAITTKGFNIDGNNIEVNDSSNSSGFTESQLSSSTFTLSVSGNCIRDPSLFPNDITIDALIEHRFNCVVQGLGESPVILVEYKRPTKTLTAYMIINSISIDDPDADLTTFSMELSLATSPTYPLTYVDTI